MARSYQHPWSDDAYIHHAYDIDYPYDDTCAVGAKRTCPDISQLYGSRNGGGSRRRRHCAAACVRAADL